MLQTSLLYHYNKNFSKSRCRLLNEVTLTKFSSRFQTCSREANNSDRVCERFKSVIRSLSSCCVMRCLDVDISGKKSGSWYPVLVVAPYLRSEKLYSPPLSKLQSTGGFGMGKPSCGTYCIADCKFGY